MASEEIHDKIETKRLLLHPISDEEVQKIIDYEKDPEMQKAFDVGLNIDYFPTNFVIQDGLLWYVDYECNDYMAEWNYDNWGIRYWSRTPEFEEYLKGR
jgi:hypothetical protein